MISRILTPTFRLSFGLVGITLSLMMTAVVLGMFPNEERAALKARASIAEALALQLSSAASQHDTRVLTETVKAVVARNEDLLSVALRRNDGEVLLSAGDHGAHWIEPHESRSSPTHIQVALSDGGRVWGRIEMSFSELAATKRLFGIPSSIASLIVFLITLGFAGYYFVLRRALKELDPGSVIPDRVQSAFNSLAEGILILDERGIILLANDAFAASIGSTPKALFGTDVSLLSWRHWGHSNRASDLPWQTAVKYREDVTGARLSHATDSHGTTNFVVNATCIVGSDGRVSGMIATFDDVTELEQKNTDLETAVKQLQQSEEEISNQNRELKYLASHDPLTGCLNRRAFFEQFAVLLADAERDGKMLTCMMADLDHFKTVNDTYGHAVGDIVIKGMADVLIEACGDHGLVGRYGGEEFCLVVPGLGHEKSGQLAEAIRSAVHRRSSGWLQVDDAVTSSIGVALRPRGTCDVGEIVDWADQALYEAKETGRNKVVFWDAAGLQQDKMLQQPEKVQELDLLAGPRPGRELTSANHGAEPAAKSEMSGPASSQMATDPLTGLPSEMIFQDRVAQAISRADWDDKTVALLQIGLDAVDEMTAAYGDDVSTEFVTIIASRFKSALKRSDTISTLDGSKRMPSLCHISKGSFMVEISDLEETNTIIWIVKRLFESLSAPVTIKDDVFYASSNIGISLYPNDGEDVQSLMRHATTARRHAQKKEGTNHYQFFCEEMNVNSRRQMGLEASIRQALDDDLFMLHFQPIINVKTGETEALEALLRSQHSNFGGVPIGSLIAVAEQTGLIVEIGEWVLKNTIRQIHAWHSAGINIPCLSINLSAIQLSNKRAMERIVHILQQMLLPPDCLQFEVTETAMLRDSEAAGLALDRIRDLGIAIALDDFGTGQSSLGYLRRFQPDILKIDRCFIGEITTSQSDETMVCAIVSMAQQLEMKVVAEGVETQSQMEKVCQIGCEAIQGFYFARPMPATEMTRWLLATEGHNLVADLVADRSAQDGQASVVA